MGSSESDFARGEIIWHNYVNSADLVADLSQRLVKQAIEALSNGSLSAKGSPSAKGFKPAFAFSGGSTPKPLFNALANSDMPWSEVLLTLVDERWVDAQHELSNQRFIGEHLFNTLDQAPEFLPLYAKADSAEHSLTRVLDKSEGLSSFEAVVLGMGNDGHTASFFPDANNVRDLVTYDDTVRLQTCISPASQVDRITWSLAALLSTQLLVLHITGPEKRALFEQASAAPNASNVDLMALPIRSVIYQDRVPLHVYYSEN